MEETAMVETEGTQTSWSDVMDASADNETPDEPETVCDVIKVPVTPELKAKLFDENVNDDALKRTLEARLEEEKEVVKGTKSEIDEIVARMAARHEAGRSGVHSIRGEWVIREVFETNTIQYLDPKTSEVVHERPMDASERQTELFDTSMSAPTPREGEPDSTSNLAGDPDDTEIDASQILDAQMTGEPQQSEPPSKPIRRRKKSAE